MIGISCMFASLMSNTDKSVIHSIADYIWDAYIIREGSLYWIEIEYNTTLYILLFNLTLSYIIISPVQSYRSVGIYIIYTQLTVCSASCCRLYVFSI